MRLRAGSCAKSRGRTVIERLSRATVEQSCRVRLDGFFFVKGVDVCSF